MPKRTDRTIYAGMSFETGLIFSKTIGSVECYSAVARANDGEITTTTKIMQNSGNTNGESFAVRAINRIFPVRTSGDFKRAAMKVLKHGNGKFESDVCIKDIDTQSNIFMRIMPLVFVLLLFVPIPSVIALLLPVSNPLTLGIIETLFAPILVFALFFGTFAALNKNTLMAKYHGAEHKAIACLEANEPLTIPNVRKHSRSSVKCGTSFVLSVLFFVAIIGIGTLFFVNIDSTLMRAFIRALSLPIAYALVFMVYKATINSDKKIAQVVIKIITAPGIWVQNIISVDEPDDEQIEVAIAGIDALLAATEDKSKQ